MSAAEALRAAEAAGVSVKLNGDRLRLEAAGPAPAAIIATLRNYRSEIINLLRPPPRAFSEVFTALEQRCPEYVDQVLWHQAVEDGRQFLARWGDQAEALGWTADELFGLHTPPSNPHPSYDRLARYDDTGLVWLLEGRIVVAISSSTAAIQHKSGSITSYRKGETTMVKQPSGDQDWTSSPYDITRRPEDRRELEPGEFACSTTIREIQRPAIKSKPDDSPDDFAI